MNKARIELKGLAFYGRHGLTEEEARLGQRFFVDLLLEMEDAATFRSDTMEASVSYVEVFATVKEVFEGRRFNLIERVAEAIAEALLERFPKIGEVSVKVKKPSVPVDCICEYFAAEVTRCR